MNEMDTRLEGMLHAYHDGELRGLARWRFERRLRRSAELRRELAGLERVAGWVRLGEDASAGPDLWDAIAQRLPAADARRREAEAAPAAPGWRWAPLGAVAAAAVAILAIYTALEPAPGVPGTVLWMDSGDHSILVLDDAEATIIWMLDDAAAGAARGGSREVA